jgi:hypothetical protein
MLRVLVGNSGEVLVMQWDLGLEGLGVLIGMSLVFGLIAQLLMRTATRWVWLFAATGYFLGGLFVSEVWFGWATEEELQPNIDGLSFDEVLLIGTIFGVLTVLLTRYVMRRMRRHPTRERNAATKGARGPGESVRAPVNRTAGFRP